MHGAKSWARRTPCSTSTPCAPLPGFPSHDKWILYAPEGDPALGLRNWLAYGAARRMGRYASRTRFAEVFLVQVGARWVERQH